MTEQIDWAMIAWTSSPVIREDCFGAAFYRNHRNVLFKRRCLSKPLRHTTEGDFCLSCWQLLPTCEKFGMSKSVIKYHDVHVCTACYLPEYSAEYLARSARCVLLGRSSGALLEERSHERFEMGGEKSRKKMLEKMHQIGVKF